MSRFVCFLYSFKASAKIVSKLVVEAEVDWTWDIVLFERTWSGAWGEKCRQSQVDTNRDEGPSCIGR